MEYIGKLYGKIGNKYFDTSHTSEDWDELNKKIEELKEEIKQGKNLLLDSVSISFEEGYREATTEAFQEIAKNYQPNER
jgi:pimeloyl-CoA synthetase